MHAVPICLCILFLASPAFAQPGSPGAPPRLPQRVGACVETRVEAVDTRLVGGDNRPVPGSGSAVRFANGGYQVGYDTVPGIEDSRRGDRVLMCLVALPSNCPPGDSRGRVYTVTNLRTLQSWTRPDASHRCSGA
ncbi:hypothetical protein JMJ56_12855 [Belnapia sp. T18]|uniref:Uncharacterized protein n=2 Tax=Belnapia arida TaxID=2804533 RepID=A0ABS1U2J4_9PROT|nr:hypothetical protein [Belnapia arida]